MTSLNSQLRPDSSVKGVNHTLHLYTSKVDKYTIQRAFLISTRNDEKAIYVTTQDPKSLIPEFNSTNIELKIIKPEEIRNLENEKNCKLRIIIDAGSLLNQKDAEVEERESYLNELSKKHSINCLCTYDVTKLNPKTIKQLAMHHNLETIILALLQKKPMCGTEIIGTIHLEFNVLFSPGTIYPLLHSLKEKGLLTSKKYGKAKTYAPAEDAELKIRSLLNDHIQARKLLNHYLQQETTI